MVQKSLMQQITEAAERSRKVSSSDILKSAEAREERDLNGELGKLFAPSIEQYTNGLLAASDLLNRLYIIGYTERGN